MINVKSFLQFLTTFSLVLFHYNKKIKLVNIYSIFMQRPFSIHYIIK